MNPDHGRKARAKTQAMKKPAAADASVVAVAASATLAMKRLVAAAASVVAAAGTPPAENDISAPTPAENATDDSYNNCIESCGGRGRPCPNLSARLAKSTQRGNYIVQVVVQENDMSMVSMKQYGTTKSG